MKELPLVVITVLVIGTIQGLHATFKFVHTNDASRRNLEAFRNQARNWQCDSGFGADHHFGHGAGLARPGGLNGIDPATFILLTLLSAGNAPVSPLPLNNGPEEPRLIPLPSSGIKLPTTEVPPTKPIDDYLSDELSFGFKSQAALTAMNNPDTDKKPRGHVTPGNRCTDDSECVPFAECVEALRQKYCVCSLGRRPKGGVCI